jgi:hypothetical protein
MPPRPDALLDPQARPLPDDPHGGATVGVPAPVHRIVERRQPVVNRRSILPVEFFRRMPGGGTTYAPLGDPPPEVTPDGR